jgi:hypothetical protein
MNMRNPHPQDALLFSVLERLETAYKAVPNDTAEELAVARLWVVAMLDAGEMHSDVAEYVEQCCLQIEKAGL